jgi:hypothetical protein
MALYPLPYLTQDSLRRSCALDGNHRPFLTLLQSTNQGMNNLLYGIAGIAELVNANSLLLNSLLKYLPPFGIFNALLSLWEAYEIGKLIHYYRKETASFSSRAYLDCLLSLGSGFQLLYFSIAAASKHLDLSLTSTQFGLLFYGFAIRAAVDWLKTAVELYEQCYSAAYVNNPENVNQITQVRERLLKETLQLAAWSLLALGHPAGLAFLAGALLISFVKPSNKFRFFKSVTEQDLNSRENSLPSYNNRISRL